MRTYGFASITAHATAMYIPFVTVIIAAGAPPYLAVLSLAYFSNLSASLTHYWNNSGAYLLWLRVCCARTVVEDRIDCLTNHDPIWVIFGFTWWRILRLW
jgi:DASS family divalent anion:Na+ symporter